MEDAPGLMNHEETTETPDVSRGAPSYVFNTAMLAYLCITGAFAAWHAADLWTWPKVALIVATPTVLAFGQCASSTARTLRDGHVLLALLFGVAAPLIAAVTHGGMGLLLAYVVADTVDQWDNRIARTVLATGGMVVTAVMLRFFCRAGRGRSVAEAQHELPPQA